MNLIHLPKEYCDMFFCGKSPKKYAFKEVMLEFVAVLVFVSILQVFASSISGQALDISIILGPALLLFVFFGVFAFLIRLCFILFKGKSTFRNDSAIIYKYGAGFLFFTSILGTIVTIITVSAESFLLIGTTITSLFVVYLFFATYPTVVNEIAKLEKMPHEKASLIYALGVTALLFILMLLSSAIAPQINSLIASASP